MLQTRSIYESTHRHVDHYAPDHNGIRKVVNDQVAFVYLTDNESATFDVGGISIPAVAGRLVTFPGNIVHGTTIKNKHVHLLGPFAVKTFSNVGLGASPPTFCGYLNTTEDGDFGILVNVLNSTGLCDALEEGGPYTLFAPTNDAFGKVPDETFECIVNNTGALTDVLKYHVIEGAALPGPTLGGVGIPGAFIKTFQGKLISVNTDEPALFINNSTVVAPFNEDVENGKCSACNAISFRNLFKHLSQQLTHFCATQFIDRYHPWT